MRRTDDATVDRLLDRLRHQGDALADDAIDELSGAARPSGAGLVGAVEARARGGGAACTRLLEQAFTVPDWVDFARMRAGVHLGQRFPLHAALSLLWGSLVESYTAVLGAKVLVRAGQLEGDTVRRIRRTAEFVSQLGASAEARPGSSAHRHLLHVRLVHAFVRRAMRRRADWDDAWGVPVNQEDNAGTLFMFSHVLLRGLGRLGVGPSEEEESSVHHVFRWVGHVIGVAPEVLTATREEERRLYQHFSRRQHHPDDDSRSLAHALVRAFDGRAPFFLPAASLYQISRHLIGDELADALEFPPRQRLALATPLLATAARTQRLVERVPGVVRLSLAAGASLERRLRERGLGRS